MAILTVARWDPAPRMGSETNPYSLTHNLNDNIPKHNTCFLRETQMTKLTMVRATWYKSHGKMAQVFLEEVSQLVKHHFPQIFP